MKHFKLLFITALIMISVWLAGCEKDEQGISFEFYGTEYTNLNVSVDTSSTLNLKFSAHSGADTMGYVKITVDDTYTLWDANIPAICKYNYVGSTIVDAPDIIGKSNLVFNLYNANPDSVSNAKLLLTQKIEINLEAPVLLEQEHYGKIYHIMAETGNCSWDLVADVAKFLSDSDADKDMSQSSVKEAGSKWVGGWQANKTNETRYANVSSFDYASATQNSAKIAFEKGISMAYVPSVKANNIIIAKLRGKDEYAVIKIIKENAKDNTGTTDKNIGSIEFTYKKK